ncbi:hypothetical protein [Actinomadura sediminis]|uniref:ATP/GTP-binding protein n=1 Tax=Actinomadura sediminis TaxID=1038904 RepID=A0ABW3EP62_9ACTN
MADNQANDVVPVPQGGEAPAPAAPATAELVQQAFSSVAFPAPVVHTSPEGRTYVRMRTSLWVDGFETFKTDPIGGAGQTVQGTATPVSVTWNLGEGRLVCDDAGSRDGRTCQYTYKRSSAGRPGGAYSITATITWQLTWACDGAECDAASGTLPDQSMTSAPTPLVVGEIQTNTGS